jgi:energy-coupling factor transporter ATP-binding protein EcfA2
MITAEKQPLLNIRDYSFKFPSYSGLQNRALFEGLNFILNRGEFWIVLGPPESGKTTLGRCLTAVYPGLTQAETSGDILIDGESVRTRSACDWIEKTGIVFQDPEEQIITTRCDDEASLALESLAVEPQEIQRRLSSSFDRFSVLGKERRNPVSLSGGEKKRLLLAALEMQDPDFWILDESMDELDRDGQIFLMNYLRDRARQGNRGILLFASKYKEIFHDSGAELALLSGGRMIT